MGRSTSPRFRARGLEQGELRGWRRGLPAPQVVAPGHPPLPLQPSLAWASQNQGRGFGTAVGGAPRHSPPQPVAAAGQPGRGCGGPSPAVALVPVCAPGCRAATAPLQAVPSEQGGTGAPPAPSRNRVLVPVCVVGHVRDCQGHKSPQPPGRAVRTARGVWLGPADICPSGCWAPGWTAPPAGSTLLGPALGHSAVPWVGSGSPLGFPLCFLNILKLRRSPEVPTNTHLPASDPTPSRVCSRGCSVTCPSAPPTHPSFLTFLTHFKANCKHLYPSLSALRCACNQAEFISGFEPRRSVRGVARCWSRQGEVSAGARGSRPRAGLQCAREGRPTAASDISNSVTFLEMEWEENCWVPRERQARGALEAVPASQAGSAPPTLPFPDSGGAGGQPTASLCPRWPQALPTQTASPAPGPGPDLAVLTCSSFSTHLFSPDLTCPGALSPEQSCPSFSEPLSPRTAPPPPSSC